MESYLESSGSEVINMLITEFNVEEYYATGREEGREAGLAEGLAKGQAKGIEDIARKMKAAGKDIAEISEFTALSVDEIERL
jgi:predicted transposase/invertase (TIGR01784 family)